MNTYRINWVGCPVPDKPPAQYVSPLCGRYATGQAKYLASEAFRWTQIRYVWLAMLESQIEMGLLLNPPPAAAITRLRETIGLFDWKKIADIENQKRHDVMSHIQYLKEEIPELGDSLHISMTSTDATENGELLQMLEYLRYIGAVLYRMIRDANDSLVSKYCATPCPAFTHWQEATPTTFGALVAMWLNPLYDNLFELHSLMTDMHLKGIRGATGTNEATLKLCNGDDEMVMKLRRLVAKKLGLPEYVGAVGQTYPRDWDSQFLQLLARIGANVAKVAFDIRFMSSHHLVSEPRGKDQDGSSAMPWKSNPMKCERVDSLVRNLFGYLNTALITQSCQGMHRTLDDSAARRICLAEGFLTTTAVVSIIDEVLRGLNVYTKRMGVAAFCMAPFYSSEGWLAQACANGAPRQETHKKLKESCMRVWRLYFNGDADSIAALSEPFLREVNAILEPYGVKPTVLEPGRLTGIAAQEALRSRDRLTVGFGKEWAQKFDIQLESTSTKV